MHFRMGDRWWWSLGPPAGPVVGAVARIFQLLAVVLVSTWIVTCLGGLGLRPKALEGGSNDTGPIFNWHPLLMILAFPLLMGEALLAYCAPGVSLGSRPAKKAYHVGLQLAAWTLALLGLMAAVKSHTLKLPTPIPNFYSTHSFLGLLVIVGLSLQILLGLWAYVWPKLSLASRTSLGPVHMFLGRAVFVLGMTAAATGLQEKAAFLQAFGGAPVDGAALRLPAWLQLVLAGVGLAVLYHHVSPAAKLTGGIVSVSSPSSIEAVPLFEQRLPPGARASGTF